MKKLKRIKQAIKYSLALGAIFFGRYPLSHFVSSRKKIMSPRPVKCDESYWIKSATGNILHVEFDGPQNALPLIFIHGLNSSLQQWYYQRIFLRNQYRLILIDLPGHGKSLPPKEFTIDGMVTDIRTIIDYFNIANGVLYGHSIGGMITLKYCLRYQSDDRLKGIILQHCTYTNALKTIAFSSILQPLERPFIIPFLQFAIKNNTAIWLLTWLNFLVGLNHLFFRYIYFTGHQSSYQLRFMAFVSALNAPATVAKGIIEALKFDVKDELGNITVPSLIIGAVHDRLTKQKASFYIHSRLANSELKSVNEGHLSLVENPSEVNSFIRDFIKKLEI